MPVIKSDWRYVEITLPLKVLRKVSNEFVAAEVERVLNLRLPNSIIALAGATLEDLTGTEEVVE